MPWHNKLQRLEEHFTAERVAPMVREEAQRLLARTREMRDGEYAKVDELRAKHVPYKDRMRQFGASKVRWCEAEEERLAKVLQSPKVRPLSEWFDEVDYWAAKRNGMRSIIRLRFNEIIA